MASKLKSIIQKYLPHPNEIKKDKSLKKLAHFIQDPNLWHLNRHSVATAFSVGLLIAFIPIPFQMATAAFFSIIFKANLPISVALTWVTNPITTLPVIGFNYYVGATLLGKTTLLLKFEPTFKWFMTEFNSIGIPLLLGCVVNGVIIAIIGNISVRLIWRYFVVHAWRKRAKRF